MEQSTIEDTDSNEYDDCVVCGAVTRFKKSDHVDTRMGYMEGLGQLCSRCNYSQRVYKQ